MRKWFIIPVLASMALASGCQSDSTRQSSESVSSENSWVGRVADYGSNDPKQEPTLRLGRQFEIRTTNGGPVVLQSQVEQQKKAAEQQRARLESESASPTIKPGDPK